MDPMSKRERVRATIAGEAVDRVPAALWRHDFLREWSPEELVAATLEAYRADDWDFIKFNPRATYFAEAWGNVYERPTTQRQPRLISATVHNAADLGRLAPVDPRDGVFGEHLRALWMLLSEVDGEVDVVQTVFSPLSVVAMLCGADATLPGTRPTRQRRGARGARERWRSRWVPTPTPASRPAPQASSSRRSSGRAATPAMTPFTVSLAGPTTCACWKRWLDAPFNILHVCRNNNMLDALLDYPVAAFNWADRGEGNPSLREMRGRTDKAIMGGIDQARIHAMSPDEINRQAAEALEVAWALSHCWLRDPPGYAAREPCCACRRCPLGVKAHVEPGC